MNARQLQMEGLGTNSPARQLSEDSRFGPRPEWCDPIYRGRGFEAWMADLAAWEARIREVTRVQRLEDVCIGTFFDGDVDLADGTVVRVTYEPYGCWYGWSARGEISETGYQSFAGALPLGLTLGEPIGALIRDAIERCRAEFVRRQKQERGTS